VFNFPSRQDYPLRRAINKHLEGSRCRFHVPSHRTGWACNQREMFDLTELEGLDNLFKPSGAIEESQKIAAEVFKADETYYLVNGSSAGLIAAIWSYCRPGDKVLLGRNVHRSVITGLVLSGAIPFFMPVEEHIAGIPLNIKVEAVEALLSEVSAPRAFIVTSPSYWGITPHLAGLREVTQKRRIPLLVDEAHGGHFIFHKDFPASASLCQADLWVNSAHKTLGALTPGAFLHQKGTDNNNERLKHALSMFQTSSPPYPVLASLERICHEGSVGWEEAIQLSSYMRQQIFHMKGFSCLQPDMLSEEFSLDPLRLTIIIDRISLTGFQVSALLRDKYEIEVEFSGPNYLILIIHPQHRWEHINILIKALNELENDYSSSQTLMSFQNKYEIPELVMTPREASEGRWQEVSLKNAVGCVSAVTVVPFPPATPILIPGELISAELVEKVWEDYKHGSFFLGIGEAPSFQIMVVKE